MLIRDQEGFKTNILPHLAVNNKLVYSINLKLLNLKIF